MLPQTLHTAVPAAVTSVSPYSIQFKHNIIREHKVSCEIIKKIFNVVYTKKITGLKVFFFFFTLGEVLPLGLNIPSLRV